MFPGAKDELQSLLVQRIHGFSQHFVADLGFFSFGNRFVLQRAIVGQPVLPFAFAIDAQRRVLPLRIARPSGDALLAAPRHAPRA